MSYESRSRKREAQKKDQAQRRNRRQHPDRWYLTPTKKATDCDRCGGLLAIGAAMVYRNKPRRKLHRACAELEKIVPRPSFSWDRQERKKRGKYKPGGPLDRGDGEREFSGNTLKKIRELRPESE